MIKNMYVIEIMDDKTLLDFEKLLKKKLTK